MAKEKEKALVPKVEFPADLPDLPPDDEEVQDSDVREEDVTPPKWRVLQGLSPEVQEHPEQFKIGEIVHSQTGEKLDRDKWHRVLVFYHFQGKVYPPKERGDPMVCISDDGICSNSGKCGYNKLYLKEQQKPREERDLFLQPCDCGGNCVACGAQKWRDSKLLCGKTQNFIMVVPDSADCFEPAILTFMRTAVPNTKNYLTDKKADPLIRKALYRRWTLIKTEQRENKKGKWYTPLIKFDKEAEPPPKKWQQLAFGLVDRFKGRVVKVEHDTVDVPGDPENKTPGDIGDDLFQ